jgi:hypothetical protein
MRGSLSVMLYGIAADGVTLLHAAFIAFVVGGGLLVWRWPRAAWLHLPAAAWGALVELMAWPCPLTPLENALRRAAGEVGYPGSFVEHWIAPVIYPAGLTTPTQLQLGLLVIAVNAVVYAVALAKRRPPRGRQ